MYMFGETPFSATAKNFFEGWTLRNTINIFSLKNKEYRDGADAAAVLAEEDLALPRLEVEDVVGDPRNVDQRLVVEEVHVVALEAVKAETFAKLPG